MISQQHIARRWLYNPQCLPAFHFFLWVQVPAVPFPPFPLFLDFRGSVFGVKLSDEEIADFDVLRDVAMATHFAFRWAITSVV